MKKFQHIIEAVLVKGLFTFLSYMPLSAASFFGYLLGKILTIMPSGMLKKSMKQMALAMPELSDAERKRIAKRSATHMLQTFFEAPRIYRMSEKCFTKRLNVVGEEYIENNAGALLLTAHFGNWEALLRMMSVKGLPSKAIYRPANNLLVDKFIVDMRARTGIGAIKKGRDGARGLVKACRNGDYVGILNDQRNTEGQQILLFGRKAWTSIGFADMAIKYNRAAVPFFCKRIGFGKFEVEILPPLPVDESAENPSLKLAQAYNDVLEQQIRKNPEQWMWQHKRFK